MLTLMVSPPAVGGLVELDLELRIAIERARDVGLARHAVTEPVEFGAGGVAQNQHEIAGLLGGKREVASARGDLNLARVAHGLLQARDVFVGAVRLLGEDREILALHPFERELRGGDGRELLVDGQPVRLARASTRRTKLRSPSGLTPTR